MESFKLPSACLTDMCSEDNVANFGCWLLSIMKREFLAVVIVHLRRKPSARGGFMSN